MAQPVFEGHPLEEYFKDSGEASELMPGGLADLQPYITTLPTVSRHAERMERLCFLALGATESLCSLFSAHRASLRAQAFAERFKYGVISSSLLSPAFPATPVVESHRRALSPSIPGRLSHSRTPSAAESTVSDNLTLSMPPEPETPVWPITISFTVVVAAFSARFYFCALLLLVATLYYMHAHRLDIRPRADVMTPSLLTLQHLVAAGRLWDTVINDTFTMLESEEQSTFYGPASPRSPSSPLRIALSTSLLTTQTQCDNVRQLLSAITSPSELAQLAEMYAPPSPIKPTFARNSESHRPLSHPGSPLRGTPTTDRTRKRSTWNGSYTSLALAGTSPAFARREKRRSDLSALLGNASPSPARVRSRNPPSSLQLLTDVSEEEEGMVTAESSLAGDEDDNSFGAAALGLYRHRVQDGLRALELTPRGHSLKPRTTMSPGSKYTSMHTARHPLSLSSLRHSLQNALASKRFACSHLLALRFEDDDDDAYWEDARAVMGLLTSTLVDASARLSQVLEEVEERRLRDGDDVDRGTEESNSNSGMSSIASPPGRTIPLSRGLDGVAVRTGTSFAPAPSHLARFGAHVDAISDALEGAREDLAQCVAALKEEWGSPGHSSRPSSSSFSGDAVPGAEAGQVCAEPEHPALRAYDRLRRELGLAFRECERGREKLMFVVAPPTPATSEDAEPREVKREGEGEGEGDADGNVSLAVLSPSGESLQVPDLEPDLSADPPAEDGDVDVDDPSLVSSGIELVFEADPIPAPVQARERARLSREERIRIARAKRDSEASPPRGDRWGPSTDVVRELQDVIWKVGERRRKLAERSAP